MNGWPNKPNIWRKNKWEKKKRDNKIKINNEFVFKWYEM